MTSLVKAIRVWAEMVRFSHTVFALPFALVSTFLAGREITGRGYPYWGQLGLIVLCMVSARSVAMTFNRIIDRGIDARNPRTAARPLPAGRISLNAAWAMLILSAITFGIGCVGFRIWYDNTLPFLLSGPVLLFLCGYSFTKRFTRWSHYYLGTAIALSPVAAWIAVHPVSLGVEALLLMIAVACWIAGFDIIYACQDIDIDRRDKLHSLPARIGPTKALWIAGGSHGVTILALAALGLTADLGLLYAIGVAIAAALLIIENALVHPGDYRRVNLAFFTVNGIVSVLLAVMAIADVLTAGPLGVG
ncbi:MAG: UbiA-like polyprenyltransferase [Phycisphaerae bacterium]|jgi:4-hydroxybenzoate polyprenyltransferase